MIFSCSPLRYYFWCQNIYDNFSISTSILLLSKVFSFSAERMIESSGQSSVFPTLIWMAGLMLSTMVGVVLPLRLCKTVKGKILTILFLPTNYVFFIILYYAYRLCHLIFNILSNFSPHFG